MKLKKLDIAITSNCNLTCEHCYQGGVKQRSISLTVKKIEEILLDAKDLGTRELTITGGEPLMHSGFKDILQIASDLGLKTRILTNATLITGDIIQEFLKYHVDIQSSLDGPKEIHERIRGNQTWNKTIKAIKTLTSEGLMVTVNAQLTEGLLEKIEKHIDFLDSLNVTEVIFSITGLFGKARSHKIYTPSDYLSKIRGLLYMDISNRKETKEMSHCGALNSRLAVNYDGVVYPCDFFKSISHYSLGNVYSESLKEIYGYWQKSNCALVRYYSEGVEECNKCEFQNRCQRCLARIFSVYKNFSHPDPMYCLLFKKSKLPKDIPLGRLVYGRI